MRFAPLVLALVCAVTLFVGLDTVGYLDVREARDGRVAEELISARDPLTPLLAREALFDKPVLGYLPEALTHDNENESPLRSRLLRAALAALLVLVTWRIGAEQFGSRAGLAGGLVLATALGLPFAARTDGTQTLAALMAWIATSDFAVAVFADRPPGTLRLTRAYVALSTALLVAGPLPALCPLGGAALYARLARRGDAWKRLRPGAGLAIMVGLGLPWYGAMIERHGASFAAHVPWMPYAVGAAGAWYAGPLVALSFLIVGGFPWSALLPAAFTHAAMRWRDVRRVRRAAAGPASPLAPDDLATLAREEREERAAHFFIAGLIVALVPIALYRDPPLGAALPALPAMALLCGRFLDHLFEDARRLSGAFARATFMLGVTGSAVAIAVSMAGARVTALFPALRWVAPLALLSGWAPFLAHLVRRPRLAAALIGLPVVLGVPLVAWRLLPELEDFLSTRTVAVAMNRASPPRAPLALLEPPPPSLWLYLARNPVVVGSLRRAPSELRAEDGNVYFAFRPSREHETARELATPLEILSRTPAMVLARARIETDSTAIP
jgi:4-amino-4-deoxy-L-arabinose transferase-like glycosyltransferase